VVATDPSGLVNDKINQSGTIPFLMFIDAKVRIAYSHTGFTSGDESDYEKMLMALTNE
jgi:hypothetical protein